MKKNKQYYFRKTHRFLGISIGIQFLFWTVSGLYFSWTDIDEIHGDQFHREIMHHEVSGLMPINEVIGDKPISDLQLRFVAHQPYYWVNKNELYHATTGTFKEAITEEDAIAVVRAHIKEEFEVKDAQLLSEVGNHHEYRGRPVPAWVVSFETPSNMVAYVSAKDGSFQRVRHNAWRWFDFLWMFHTMDYEGRDDINNLVLRAFSIFGLATVCSGFALFFVSSKPIIKLFRK